MSKYTTEIRYICESLARPKLSSEYADIDQIISIARPMIFDFDFPIFDESYRAILETNILRHFYTREIAAETYTLWKLWLKDRLNLIMPQYNARYLMLNSLYEKMKKGSWMNSTDMNTTSNTKGDSTSQSKQTGNVKGSSTSNDQDHFEAADKHEDTSQSVNRQAYSDTPQGKLSNVEDNTYLTSYSKDTSDNTQKGTAGRTTSETRANQAQSSTDSVQDSQASATSLQDYIEHTWGYNGTNPLELYTRLYKAIQSIELDLMHDLNDLFFALW